MRRAVFVVTAAFALGACSLLTSLDELYEGSRGAGPPLEAGAPEASADVFDAVAADAGREAGVPYCSTVIGAAICADFDDTSSPPFPFNSISLKGASNSLTYDSADSKSPPRSLYIVGGPTTGGNTAAALLWKAPPIAASQELVAELDFKVEQRGTNPLDLLQFERAGHELSIEVAANGKLQFDYRVPDGDGGSDDGTVATSASATGTWQHVKWVAKKETGTRFKVDVSVDGAPAGSTTVNQTLFVGEPTVVIGDAALEPSSTPWKARIDNVLVTVK